MGVPGDSVVKNMPANAGDTRDMGLILGLKDSLEEEMAIHAIILSWKDSMDRGPGRVQSTGLQRVRHNWTHTARQNMAKVLS